MGIKTSGRSGKNMKIKGQLVSIIGLLIGCQVAVTAQIPELTDITSLQSAASVNNNSQNPEQISLQHYLQSKYVGKGINVTDTQNRKWDGMIFKVNRNNKEFTVSVLIGKSTVREAKMVFQPTGIEVLDRYADKTSYRKTELNTNIAMETFINHAFVFEGNDENDTLSGFPSQTDSSQTTNTAQTPAFPGERLNDGVILYKNPKSGQLEEGELFVYKDILYLLDGRRITVTFEDNQ